jgi:CRISPR-associated endonuclease/helicase Cas3
LDENALAKSAPKEDIQTHTDNLLKNVNLLKELYPNLKVDWGLLHWACVYHDLGKLHFKFQDRIKGIKHHPGEIPHGLLSLAMIDHKALKNMGYDRNAIKLLYQAVAYHHDRKMPFQNEEIEKEFAGLYPNFASFEYDKLPEKLKIATEINQRYFSVNKRFYEERDKDLFFEFIMLEGLLNRMDYAASAGIPVETPNDFLSASMDELMCSWQEVDENTNWNDLQIYMRNKPDKNLIVIAQTGMGKTEAGLLWLGNAKGFFTLPLKSAINAIYKRISEKIVREKMDERVGLLHSDTYIKYLEQGEKDESISLDTYYTKTRQLSLPLTICTLDQLFNFVFRYRGFEQKLATLSYSKVIIDEVQMYSPELIAYLVLGLHYITRMEGKFAILTATLPTLFLDLLREQDIIFEPPQIFTNDIIRHSLKVLDEDINSKDIADISKQYGGKKILVICNTIKSALKLYHQLAQVAGKQKVWLLHSHFTKEDRSIKESHIMEIGKRENTQCGIWVATQIVEASLDIDFDLLFTELSDLNGLFQRMGRCYRNRILDMEYNCFVFTGGNKRCSGVGAFIDKKVHNCSKESLVGIDGIITEGQKIAMVEELYTKEKLSDYYRNIKENIDYVKSINEYEFSKTDVNNKFRSIDTVSVIPRGVYNKYQVEINEAINILKADYSGVDKSEARVHRASARRIIAEQTVDIPFYLAQKIILKKIYINAYEQLSIAECEYNSQEGIIKPDMKTGGEDFSSHSF